MASPIPLRLTEAAAGKLPRWALAVMLLVYALPGLFGRDPWRADDASGFGVMLTMARGSLADWWMPNIFGSPVLGEGPLFYWIGAGFIRLLGGVITADEAARVATLVAGAGGAAALWYGVYLLGRRPDAQPQALAFGGQPAPQAFGRAVADGALLLVLATLGLLVRAHESSQPIAGFACACLALFGLARSLDRPIAGALSFGAAVGAAGLTLGWTSAAIWPFAVALAAAISPSFRRLGLAWHAIAWSTAAALLALWLLPLATQFGDAGRGWLDSWLLQSQADWWIASPRLWSFYPQNAVWFLWPLWPIAVWGAWVWRQHWRLPQFALPTAGLLAGLLYIGFGRTPGDSALLVLMPAMAMLAAFGLPTLRRGASNLIDWFALIAFTLFALWLWFTWMTTLSGWPPRYALNLAKRAPGWEGRFSFAELLVAAAVCVGWVRLVLWRVREQPEVLWRSAVLSAGGITLCWSLFMTFLLPYVDYVKTYRHVSAELRTQLPAGECIQAADVGLPQRASLVYFDGYRIGGSECGWRLRHENRNAPLAALDKSQWQPVWTGRRRTDPTERFTLYRRVGAPAVAAAPRP
ncbi:ArnT family glycosyltransferase [Derxia lacustris]|uniref:ArnT family glycosyltransferase n=1 Tax=Derxia lacustris TaxID=764842 RepID=UPI001594C57B|nr:glycosyltransferase [Derxia lacustris]